MINVILGERGLNYSHQATFPKTTKCCLCGGKSRIGFVAYEMPTPDIPREDNRFVCDLHPNDPTGEGYWLHDCCAVAIYFCVGCLGTTALYNQA